MTVRLKSLLWTWLPVLLWLSIIFVESTDLLSSTSTGTTLYEVLTKVFGPINRHKFDIFHAILRKSGHFIGYGILGLLFYRAIKNSLIQFRPALFKTTKSLRQRSLHWATEAIFCTAIVASLDEWHQSFSTARTGALHDIVLDTFGAAVLITLVLFRSRTPRPNQ